MTWNLGKWAEDNFGACELGDVRRTRRLVSTAECAISNPTASLPQQISSWSDLKATYRLFDNKHVTAESVGSVHWQRTKEQARGDVLVICDTTEIDFGSRREIEGAGPTGNGSGNGFLLHNALLVEAGTQVVLGLGAQAIHTRPRRETRDHSAQKLRRKRESQIWGKTIDLVGPAGPHATYTVVADRGSDNYEVFLHLLKNQHGWILRAKSQNRIVLDQHANRISLAKSLQGLQDKGSYELKVRGIKNRPARTAFVEVAAGPVELPQPRQKSPLVKKTAPETIATNIVWVRETDAPEGVTPVEWILYTSLPVNTFDECWKILEGYETRWLIEEYHKALKTGCRVEGRQLQTADRLQPVAAFLSVIAVALLQLKSYSKVAPDTKAQQVVPSLWLKMLKAVRPKLKRVFDITVYDFYRQIAMLGGFIGRASDGEPGWITTWRGWQQLHLLVRGAQALQKTGKARERFG